MRHRRTTSAARLSQTAPMRYAKTVSDLKALVLRRDSDLVELAKLLLAAELIHKILGAIS